LNQVQPLPAESGGRPLEPIPGQLTLPGMPAYPEPEAGQPALPGLEGLGVAADLTLPGRFFSLGPGISSRWR